MLKGVPSIISPELLYALSQMGHGDELVIADGNFPCHSVGKNSIVIRADGHGVPEILDAVLKLIPLDTYVESPAMLMATAKDDPTPEIWAKYEDIITKNNGETNISQIERFKFYERTREAYAVIATSESALYANIILKKGVVK